MTTINSHVQEELRQGFMLPQLIFQQLDQSRRRLGKLLDTVGLGPQETPYRVVFSEPGVKLRDYGGDQSAGPLLVIVAAPLKRPYIWDLLPQVSVVQRCQRSGLRVYLIEWEQPGQEEREFGLAEYADRLILDCLDAIAMEGGPSQVFLAGHSLGGTLAAIFSALHPARLKGLILAGAPLHFDQEVGLLGSMLAVAPRAQRLTALLGNVPGSLLSGVGLMTAPVTFGWARWLDWLNSLADRQARQTYLRVDRWTFDEMPLARRLFEEAVELLAREDRFMRGTLIVGGKRAAPEFVEAPLLSILDARCRLVPPEAVLPFHRAVRSVETKTLWYQGDTGVSVQHVGMLVGRQAHQQLWPEVIRWMQTHWENE